MMNLKELREAKGLTQKQVADMLGVTVGYISSVECSTRKIGIDKAIQLSEIYGVFIETILRKMGYAVKSRHIVISDKSDGGVVASITDEDIVLNESYVVDVEWI